ncbi:MFS transporter, CP family, cyanate transporter [Burkholderiales bacterium 8X]|nr:MFS transporter, CP family, cyanate transporter [Burkholderiales bacterium 8X]
MQSMNARLVPALIKKHPLATSDLASAESTTRSNGLLLGLSVILIAFNLRPVFSSLSVVLPEVVAATGMSPAAASALTTLPVICLGLFAIVAPWLGRRMGLEKTLLACMGLITVGTVLRGTGSVPTLFVATALAGIGIAISNVLMSGLVKRDFERRAALMMGGYTMAVCGGAAGAAGLTVPLQHAFGLDWTGALALWAVPALFATLLWAPQALKRRHQARGESNHAVRGLWSDPLAWQVTLFMGLQSSLAYSVMSWLAPILRERGLPQATAGFVVSVSVMTQVVTCLIVPGLALRQRNQVALAVGSSVLTVVAMLACMFAPSAGIWTYAVVLGIAQGSTFALGLTLIVLRSPNADIASRLSGMAQGVGYLIAACGPLLVGLLRAWTGSFRASAWLFASIGVALVLAAMGAGRAKLVNATRVD